MAYKHLIIGGAAATALLISLPVAATHNHGLRGMFTPGQTTQVGHNSQYVPAGSWQTRRLVQQYEGGQSCCAPQPVQPDHAPSHRGYSVAPQGHMVQTTQYSGHGYTVGAPIRKEASWGQRVMSGLGLRGYSDPHAVKYDRHAAQDFQRHANVGGLNVRTSSAHSNDMLDWQESTTSKTMVLLANRANGTLAPNSLYLGGGFQGGFKYQKTEVDGQFPILSRFPFFSDRTDDEAGVFAIDHAALSFTSTFGDYTTVYLQPEYSETEYPREQDEFQLRKAFVVFGNLEKSPFYAAFGRKTIDFGNFDSYNAFTLNEGQHYFQAVSDQPVLELGLYNNGWKLTGSAWSAGRQLRVALAGEDNNLGNYAFNAEKEFLLGQDFLGGNAAFTVGGGYLHDTIYRDNWTAHTFAGRQTGTPPANFIEYRNSAVNGFAEYNSDFFDAMVEYTTTLEPWAAAIPQTIAGVPFDEYLFDPAGSTTSIDNINFDEKLSTLVAQARIKPWINGRQAAIAVSGSWGNISDSRGNVNAFGQPTSFEKNQQHAASFEYPISDYMDFGVEYVYNKGFIPFVAPQQVSNDQTEAHAVNVGFKARF